MDSFPVSAFEKTLTRRALYKRAHSDPQVAEWVRTHDPKYGSRAKLTRFENFFNDTIVTVSIIPLSILEVLVGSVLDAYEKRHPERDSKGRRAYEAFKYQFADPFHRKRALYTLDTR